MKKETFKAEIIINIKCLHNYQPLFVLESDEVESKLLT